MGFNNQNIKSLFYKYWWLYYLLFFLLLGVLIYLLTFNRNVNERIAVLNNRFDDCYKERLSNDSVRVVNNSGSFGCLSFTLIWDSSDDLDLHVIDAKQDSIYYKKHCKSMDNNFSQAGGQLDIDLNADNHIQNNPIENVYFQCIPPSGVYKAEIHAFEKRDARPVAFRLIIREKGKIIEEHSGVLKRQTDFVKIANFNYHGN